MFLLSFRPAVVLPSPDYYTVAVRFCPLLFNLRESKTPPVIPLPYRMIFAIATKCSVYLYDTQQRLPFGLISNINYTRLTDLAWSNDANTLLVSSTDGYCSIVQFADGELGQEYKEQSLQDILMSNAAKDEPVKKKKKVKRTIGAKKEDDKEKSPSVEEKENEDEKMDVDSANAGVSIITDPPKAIKGNAHGDNIIKSNDIFSPEKQVGSPATPIQVRKFPRAVEEDKSPPKNDGSAMAAVTTPKNSHVFSSKTPTRIEVRRHSRVLQSQPAGKVNEPDELSKAILHSPMDRKLPPVNAEKTTPRRIELQTISTPKSKKKLL